MEGEESAMENDLDDKEEGKTEQINQALIDQKALHESMMKFTSYQMFNQKNRDISLPAIPQPKFNMPGGNTKNLPHSEYYKKMKEQYI